MTGSMLRERFIIITINVSAKLCISIKFCGFFIRIGTFTSAKVNFASAKTECQHKLERLCMNRVNQKHTNLHQISATELLEHVGLESIETYIIKGSN